MSKQAECKDKLRFPFRIVMSDGNKVIVDDWDQRRSGYFFHSDDIDIYLTRNDIEAALHMLYAKLPQVNAQGMPRSSVDFMLLSGDLSNTRSREKLAVFVASCEPSKDPKQT